MTLRGIRPGDIVQGDVRGSLFHAYVDRVEGSEIAVSPISRNVTFRRLTSRQVIAHWRKATGSKPQITRR